MEKSRAMKLAHTSCDANEFLIYADAFLVLSSLAHVERSRLKMMMMMRS